MKVKVRKKLLSKNELYSNLESYSNYMFNVVLKNEQNVVQLLYVTSITRFPIIICEFNFDKLYKEYIKQKDILICYEFIDEIMKEFTSYMVEEIFYDEEYCKHPKYIN